MSEHVYRAPNSTIPRRKGFARVPLEKASPPSVPFPSRTYQTVPLRTSSLEAAEGAVRERIKPVSDKRRAENRERTAMRKAHFPGEPRCIVPWCPRMADDLHEILTRARGGSITDPANCAPVCRQHNGDLAAEPQWGYDLGLLRHEWEPAAERPEVIISRLFAAVLARDLWCAHCGSASDLHPYCRQPSGPSGHGGACPCAWVGLCAGCGQAARADVKREVRDEGLTIGSGVTEPYTLPVWVHLEDDRGGMRKYPSCEGGWADEMPEPRTGDAA